MKELLTAHDQKKYWIGGDEIGSEDTWRWEDKSAWEYTAFLPEQPSNWSGIQECLAVWKKKDYGWRDNMCDLKRFAVCKHFPEGMSVNTPF